jgi:hypothetical protein
MATNRSYHSQVEKTKGCAYVAMDNTLTGVLAALGGSAIGATTPVISNFLLQRSVTQRELTSRTIAQREELYAEFMRQGSVCYVKALSQDMDSIDEIVALYTLVNRMKLFATESVLKAAEAFVQQVVDKYGEANLSISQITTAAREQHLDPLGDFALECRAELRQAYARAGWGRP